MRRNETFDFSRSTFAAMERLIAAMGAIGTFVKEGGKKPRHARFKTAKMRFKLSMRYFKIAFSRFHRGSSGPVAQQISLSHPVIAFYAKAVEGV